MKYILTIILSIHLYISYGQNSNSKMIENPHNLKIGDCLTFKDTSLKHIGFILIKIVKINQNTEYSFAPINLDTTVKGVDQFLKGQIYIGEFMDWGTGTPQKAHGLPVFTFLDENLFNLLFPEFNKAGSLNIKKEYLQISGGTSEGTIERLKDHLKVFDTGFSFMAKLYPLEVIIDKR